MEDIQCEMVAGGHVLYILDDPPSQFHQKVMHYMKHRKYFSQQTQNSHH